MRRQFASSRHALVRRFRWFAALTLFGSCAMPTESVLTQTALAEDTVVREIERCWIGTYGGEAGGKGIYVVDFDRASGKFDALKLAVEFENPSFLALHPTFPKALYSVGLIQKGGEKKPVVASFEIQPTGELKLLNHQSSQGAGPCHLSLNKQGKALVVANYGGGNIASFPVFPFAGGNSKNDLQIGPLASAIQHRGASVNPKRQESPHAHSINVDPSGRFAVAADLGLDQLLVYRLDQDTGKLAPATPPSASVSPGSGPRHFAFHPSGKYGWVINELANTVTGFSFNDQTGELKEIQTISTLPSGYTGTSYTAEVVVHPSGKFLYGSNRGHDSICMFRVDESTGQLTALGQESTQGKTPRNFALSRGGEWLFAENQASNTIVVFKVDPRSGTLTATGEKLEVPSPVCLRSMAMTITTTKPAK